MHDVKEKSHVNKNINHDIFLKYKMNHMRKNQS